MFSIDKFREVTGCVPVGSRLIVAEWDGKRNVDVGTYSATGFIINLVGEQMLAAHAKANDEAIAEVVADAVAVAAAADANLTFTERAAKKGKK